MIFLRKLTIFYGALLLSGANLALQGVSMLFRIWLSRTVGAEGLGLMQLILSVGALAMTVGVSGARVTAMYLCAEEQGLRRERGVARVVGACARYGIAASMTAGLALILGAELIAAHWIGNTGAAASLRLLGLFLPADCLCAILTGWFTASGRIWPLVAVEGFERIASIGMTVLLLRTSAGNPADTCRAIVLGGGLASLLGLIAMGILCFRALPTPNSDIPVFRRMLRMCLPLALGDYVKTGLSTASHLLIPRGLARYDGSATASVAAYGMIHGMVFPVIYFPSAFLYALVDLLIPELSRLRVRGMGERIRALSERCFRTGAVFACACAGVLHLFARPLSVTLFHNPQAGIYLALFAPLTIILYLDAVTDGLLKGLGQQLYCVRCNIFTSALEVTGLIFLLPKLGVTGYFLTFTVTRLINYLLSAARLLKVSDSPLPARFCVKLALCFGACVTCLRAAPWLFLPAFVLSLAASRTVTRADLQWLRGGIHRPHFTLTTTENEV